MERYYVSLKKLKLKHWFAALSIVIVNVGVAKMWLYAKNIGRKLYIWTSEQVANKVI